MNTAGVGTRSSGVDPGMETLKCQVDALENKIRNQEMKIKKVDERSRNNENSIIAIRRQILDIKRQVTKVCVTMYGRDVPLRSRGEIPLNLFLDCVHRKYGLILDKREIAACHRRGNGRDLIAKFTHFGPESSYEKLTKRHYNWDLNKEVLIYISVLLTPIDEKIRFYASKMKGCKLITNYRTERSGRISICRLNSSMYQPINEIKEIEDLLTDQVLEEITKHNKDRNRVRRDKKKEARGQGRGNPGPEQSLLEDVEQVQREISELIVGHEPAIARNFTRASSNMDTS